MATLATLAAQMVPLSSFCGSDFVIQIEFTLETRASWGPMGIMGGSFWPKSGRAANRPVEPPASKVPRDLDKTRAARELPALRRTHLARANPRRATFKEHNMG